jgi:hypothetical protein
MARVQALNLVHTLYILLVIFILISLNIVF